MVACAAPRRWTEIEADKFEIEGIAQSLDGEVYISASVIDAEGRAVDGI